MIQSISNYSSKSYIQTKNYSDASVHSKLNQQISFTGLSIATLNKGDTTSLLSKVVGKSRDLLTGSFRKMTRRTEFPIVSKPLIAASARDDSVVDEAQKVINNTNIPRDLRDLVQRKLEEVRTFSEACPEHANTGDINSLSDAVDKAKAAITSSFKGGLDNDVIDNSHTILDDIGDFIDGICDFFGG